MRDLPVSQNAVTVADFMPAFSIDEAKARRNAMVQFVQSIMVEGVDYGKIPGVDKASLLKPGAERLVTFFGLSPEFILESSTEDWTGKDHGGESFFYYRYRCRLTKNGHLIGEGEGSCNSWEIKYRYRWMSADQIPDSINRDKLVKRDDSATEPVFAVNKGETGGKYGKPAEYWKRFKDAIANGTAVYGTAKTKTGGDMDTVSIPSVKYRVPNPDVAEVVNTIQKMSQKRALVAATLVGVNASEFFTQDVEDMQILDVPFTTVETVRMVAERGKDCIVDPPILTGKGEDVEYATPPMAVASKSKAKTEPDPAADFYQDDAILKLAEAADIGGVTKIFNSIPAEHRRPGTKVFEAFQKRRKELMPPQGDGDE